ncbi:GNAT family N-acetyltransferase [Streptomyces caelestis]|uniref:GNAT family N-acetyltransferase n=1 Tax=Streptomyces caelestis TaxID=36816 RepID=UPI0036671EEF
MNARTSSSPAHTPPRVLPEVRGHGLCLRAWDPESRADVETWLRGLTDPEFRRWNTPLHPIVDADGARESPRRGARRVADGTGAPFRIAGAGTGTAPGHVGVDGIHPVPRRAAVGYWVLPEARGRGVATRALRLVAHRAFTGPGPHRLEPDHAVGHGASCRTAGRCGFRHEGTMRGALFEDGRYDAFRDAHLHARLATDPEPVLRATATP